MDKNRLTFRETDEAGNPTATFIYSGDGSKGRVDVISSSKPTSWSKPLFSSLSDVFLPSGYPHSVSDDYLPYQVFDSLQAFSSSIAGLLSSRAVLQGTKPNSHRNTQIKTNNPGVGVGNATASPTSALLLHILQDTSGRIATILFAHRVGTALEPECKSYRLAADIFNDIAMILDCLSPGVPGGAMRVAVLSAAGVLRALCGVAGGSSKASLSAHFARWGNLAEVNAKDSSQETVISLFGMLVGSLVISHITSFTTTWAVLLLLLATHLSMNYAAVRAVQMTSLNRQRANIVFSALLASDQVLALRQDQDLKSNRLTPLTPAQVARQERIFPNGTLQWTDWSTGSASVQTLGSAKIGISMALFLDSIKNTSTPLDRLTALFQDEAYMLFLSPLAPKKWHVSILLKKECSVADQLKAWAHGLLAARILRAESESESGSGSDIFDVIEKTLSALNGRFAGYLHALGGAGWDVDIAALETGAGKRVDVDVDVGI
ncbi:uncharacterized protein N7529_011384 [Penicillium soppii]|uniref:uncharacterized protein n=1 Tax=Penicillium soppii TaxID=69789 RepID=UPI0025495ED0|nr:uncharacterized protein N7529_011384 [Penicillium soppii]KAJ5851999.1 hypothetical protein N7529_011384 [Penicillium soppii]